MKTTFFCLSCCWCCLNDLWWRRRFQICFLLVLKIMMFCCPHWRWRWCLLLVLVMKSFWRIFCCLCWNQDDALCFAAYVEDDVCCSCWRWRRLLFIKHSEHRSAAVEEDDVDAIHFYVEGDEDDDVVHFYKWILFF